MTWRASSRTHCALKAKLSVIASHISHRKPAEKFASFLSRHTVPPLSPALTSRHSSTVFLDGEATGPVFLLTSCSLLITREAGA